MHDFHYHNDALFCEDVPLERLAKEQGTPCYIYSHATLTRHFRAFDQAFAAVPHLIAFAMKANSNLAILRLMASLGSGADIVSGGELFRALQAGIPPSKIVFAGVGKSPEEIGYALDSDILLFNVESPAELQAINDVARGKGLRARVALRVNPDIDPQTHPYITTGLKKSKFGIGADRALEDFTTAASLPNVEVIGVHAHIGSQLTQVSPFVDSLKRVVGLIETLKSRDIPIRYLNIGGGLGITYSDETPPLPTEYAEAIMPLLKASQCEIIMEPGRVIAGNAGVMLTHVLYIKETGTKNFAIVDAAMNDLLRPSLYQAHHDILPVRQVPNAPDAVFDVVGPVCESGDFLAQGRTMPKVKAGNLLAVMSAGAYGFTMASNYNSRPRVPEILVKGGEHFVIRDRETFDDLVRGERIPAFLEAKA
ncbi:MAG: diaminopimelate decarboxylase [Nitrospira sp. SB0677_bin_15]|nr:diaminopimelate decarboxylase [Nitrospira sp. SB0667_bin_9]MYD30946.1 diaminopimelate decarboxylase [Nitrospira sp. SB0661_bin_20]MYG40233.1 diaminopimelate decarboxylase [Nitrospira sp. SB0677_bin_15]MYH01481.1 diaminopimelate decarboxylase [Nitrospira sp. SB0675_bin_23]MYJ21950.1 diaminopimelate decarboxylase [Nitrospira sp. SB0673_bin_12]